MFCHLSCVMCFKSRRLYDEAMTKGYVETSVTKCLIVGAAGVGKTHLKHLLLQKDPPDQRVSTGLADNPVRAISFTLAGVGGQEENDWFVIEDDHAGIDEFCWTDGTWWCVHGYVFGCCG